MKIVFYIDKTNVAFPGYSIIIKYLLEHIPNSCVETSLKEIRDCDVVIPLGIVASQNLYQAGIQFKISFLCDSPTLNFKSKMEFNLRRRKVGREFVGALLRYVKYTFIERKIVRYVKKVIVVSSFDRQYLEDKYKFDKFYSIPNGVTFPNKIKIKKDAFKPTIGFLYFWGVQNSIDDIDWFIKSFLPEIRYKFPELEVLAAGRGANQIALKYFKDNEINYIGPIDDLNDFFSKIDVFVTTVRKKCGILNKVLDAIAHEKIVMALEGNMLAFERLEDGYYTYNSVEGFIENLENIKSNPMVSQRRVKNALDYTKTYHDWKINYTRLFNHIRECYPDRFQEDV